MSRKRSHSGNTVGSWAVEKLDALQDYLNAYLKVLKNQNWAETIYVDAFAGAGRSKLRQAGRSEVLTADQGRFDLLDTETISEVEKYVQGSPLRALDLDVPFKNYFFFDSDSLRADMLLQLRQRYRSLKIEVKVGDANLLLSELAPKIRRINRVFAFLDPYGPQLKWQTVASLAHTGVVEVLINLPIQMAINRMIRKSGEIPPSWKDELTAVFGSEDWLNVSYETENTLMSSEKRKVNDAGDRLLNLYYTNLKSIFNYVSVPRLVRNTRSSPLYFLIWAGQNEKGYKIADYVLRQGEHVSTDSQRRLL